MAQMTYSIRIDQDKKNQFDVICERLGLTASAAISTFINKTVEEQGLPYELKLKKTPSDYGIIEEDKLTHAELMAEIQKGMDSIDNGKYHTFDEARDHFVNGGRENENI